MSAWWGPEAGNMIGSFGSAGLGVLCGCLGAIGGVFGPRGKAKGLVLGMHGTLAGVCGLALLTGIAAALSSQPYHVWYPLVLVGGIGTFVLGPLFPVVAKRYREADQRRLQAEQLRRG